MKGMYNKIIRLFLRLSLGVGFLSACADRFGLWGNNEHVEWGNWDQFKNYTAQLNPWVPISIISTVAVIATIAEILFGFALIIGFKIELFAKLSGVLLLIFAVSMTFSTGIKTAFDASVYTASAASFALGAMKGKYLACIIRQNTQSFNI